MRNKGSPHTRPDQRAAGRKGVGRADVMPPQGSKVPDPKFFGARYSLGAPIRPKSIVFDNGFLDKFKPRAPTLTDYAALAKWRLKVEAAETLRPDLEEGCKAYKHFLDGNGSNRIFSYEMYVLNDEAGRITLSNAMLDIQDGAEVVWEGDKNRKKFNITSGQISCGSDALFPYPRTENWQKAIGGHVIWLSGSVVVKEISGETWFELDMTLHAEDRYNFNPGQADIATGIPDSDNGTFEITGLGKQYTQTATLRRVVKWKYGTLKKGNTSDAVTPLR
jgi:hypothetical protein